ncbi:serine--tRNA ligase, mitochondrial [Daktulosphaira vitifoliae]|uniref:serine--tRNA ligase, mitochondrial n=1 Tax=Daktulosphaira vitifoliae TaxID=58002 RepID=UPI0021A9F642|nr:serine--tRNA ligase, mitochondrial [Daktulosphaira vitifoliae]
MPNFLNHNENQIHPEVEKIEGDFTILKYVCSQPKFDFQPLPLESLKKLKHCLKASNLSNYCGDRRFKLISVPDILPDELIEKCGMHTKGERTQVYNLNPHYYGNTCRCYRAEVSNISEEKGVYRVHQFTKVEMFGVCLPEDSEKMTLYFRSIQEELYSLLGLHYRVLDMAKHELGAQAYRKYDIEAWMPGRKKYGEISSCSNCSDYQAKRLNIHSNGNCLHTVNGTACAIPRLIIALAETHQTVDGSINIPNVLSHYITGKSLFQNLSSFPKLTPVQAHRYE